MLTKAQIQLIKSLSDKGARYENGLFVVEGRKMVGEAVAAGAAIEAIYALSESGVADAGISPSRMSVEYVSPKEMERMSHLKTPTQVLALVRIPKPTHGIGYGEELAIFLDGVQDPGNLGTIIRLADWFGISTIVCSQDSADCYNPKVVQATMGALFRVAVRYGDLCGVLRDAAGRGVDIYGAFLEGGVIYDAELSHGGIIVMGSEGRGISADVAKLVNRKLFIPPFPAGRSGSESLNVAVATAIVCSEFRRRK